MTKNEIIGELFTSKDFISCINKMEPASLREDLKSEVALVLLEKEDSLIIGLHQRSELKFYTVRVILNMIQSKTSPFYRTFRSNSFLARNGSKHKDTLYHRALAVDLTAIETRFSKIFEDDLFSGDAGWFQDEIQEKLVDSPGYDTKPDEALNELDNLYWYDREIMKLYAEYGTFRKVEEVTQIPWESVYKTVRKNCEIIRKKIA